MEIIWATKELIAERGIAGVSFREIGRRMGGSSTLVTHYFPTVSDLFHEMAVAAVETWQEELRKIEEKYPDPAQRLNVILFEWLLPLSGEELVNERARINLVAAGLQGQDIQELLDLWETGVKEVLRPTLGSLVEKNKVEQYADALRVAFNGLALSTVEHPNHWTVRRQRATFRTIVEGLGLPIVPTRPRLPAPDNAARG
ncbi:MAG: TetR/AcrR family transcriptional regulator [Nocardioides sp.]|uniref:TetR/AcrR family transcriptional regulator n=1 Tax=Nocardioides sp. TaxID=35761 RepID=UPI0039E6B5F3